MCIIIMGAFLYTLVCWYVFFIVSSYFIRVINIDFTARIDSLCITYNIHIMFEFSKGSIVIYVSHNDTEIRWKVNVIYIY